MKRRNATRNALLMSVLSMLLCVSMLVGTTFAWFTDSVVSGSNVITSGNLDIEVTYTVDGENWAALDGATDLFPANDLWEPGFTRVVVLKIENKGNLALKYVANMEIFEETKGINKFGNDFYLSDVLSVSTLCQEANDVGEIALALAYMGENSVAYETSAAFKSANVLKGEQELFAGDAHYLFIKVDMPETVGNEANHNGHTPSINFGINVLATQYTHESDSFGNQYDKDASVVLANNEEELLDAIDAVAGTVATIQVAAGEYTFPASKLKDGMTLECAPGTVFEGNSKLNIDGATVVGATFSNPGGSAADQTINGTFRDCTFTGKNGLRWCYAGDTVVFENCVFSGDVYGVHFDGGANNVVFKNCTFSGFNAMGGEIELATFEGCTFKANDRSGYNGINLWGSTVMTDCTFVFDGSKTEWVDLCGDNKTATFTNCVVTDGTNETPIKDVVGNCGDGNTIIIDGVTKN